MRSESYVYVFVIFLTLTFSQVSGKINNFKIVIRFHCRCPEATGTEMHYRVTLCHFNPRILSNKNNSIPVEIVEYLMWFICE
jgi:hypothetical protein